MTKFINLTPHALNVHTPNGIIIIPVSGDIARVTSTKSLIDTINDVPIFDTIFGDVVGLPTATEGVVFIVSRIVKNAVPNRKDVLVPGNPIRNDDGVITGADGLTL